MLKTTARPPGFHAGVSFPRSRRSSAIALQLPAILVLVALTLFPVVYSLNLSFTKFSYVLPGYTGQWVGVENYVRLVGDAGFWHSAWLISVFCVVGVTAELLLGTALAVALDAVETGRRLLTSLLLIPMVLTPLVIGLMFNFLFNAQFGLFSYLISLFGIPLPAGVLGNQATAFAALIVTDIWEWTPFMTLIMLAGMQALPSEPKEAARVDGATGSQILRFVTLPMLRPLVAVAVLLRAAEAIKEFDKVYILTGGGPGSATEVVDLYTYRVAFGTWDMSYGAALGMVLFLATMVAAAIYFWLMGRGGAGA
jgi:multiple sugar transport system permease protein